MKLAKFILNLLQLIFAYVIISAVTFGVYSVIAFQADDKSARFTIAPHDDRVWMLDNFGYWADDIAINIKGTELPQPKLRVALWFDWNWWRNGISKVDMYVINPLVSAVKPIITPISSADEIKTYYDRNLADFSDYINASGNTALDFAKMVETYFGGYNVDIRRDDNNKFYIPTEELEMLSTLVDINILVNQDADNNGSKDIFDVADDYNYMYQLLYKLNKYNKKDADGNLVYAKWYNKFVTETDANGRILTTAVYALYSLNYINIILAVFYCWSNVIDVDRDEYGTIIPNHGFHRKKRHKRHKHRKDKTEQKNAE